jgi:histidinol-phosphate aminotransferase
VPRPTTPAADSPFRPAIRGLVPYEPGRPIEEIQRELGLQRVVKLASNEGTHGPFPAALEALERTARELNRYPDGGAHRLREALAERHGVRFEQVAPGAGADGVVDCLSQVLLDPGDEIVCGWPSFPSYAIDARKMGAEARLVPLRDHRYDLEALLGAVGRRTKIVYLCYPNNPTGTANDRAELDTYFAAVPDYVLTVIDQAYFEYVDDPAYCDAVETYLKNGHNVVVLRTFSKIYGLAGLRVGYGVGPEAVVQEVGKVRRAFDLTTPGQEAALASLGDEAELGRRRAANREAMNELAHIVRAHGLQPAEPAIANFVYVEVGEDATMLFERLLREGVIVRPLHAFGAPDAIRITAGRAEDLAFLNTALADVVGSAARR